MQTERQKAREQLVTTLLEGHTFQEVSRGSPVPVKRAMAYRLLRAVRIQGQGALQDRRQGHPSKLCGAVRLFLETSCRAAPHTPSSVVQTQLQERFDVQVSISQINRVRKQLGVSNHAKNQELGKKRQHRKRLPLKASGRKEQEVSCS
jgi:transposase